MKQNNVSQTGLPLVVSHAILFSLCLMVKRWVSKDQRDSSLWAIHFVSNVLINVSA